MARKVMDCRQYPGSACSLTISGEEEEVMRAATDHAVSVHGETRGPELEAQIRKSLTDEVPMQVSAPPSPEAQARH